MTPASIFALMALSFTAGVIYAPIIIGIVDMIWAHHLGEE